MKTQPTYWKLTTITEEINDGKELGLLLNYVEKQEI
jgi:hypothetical protein